MSWVLQVIQKLLERVASERMALIRAFTGNVYSLATHPYGCRVLQRCFEYASQEQITPLIEELHENAQVLMQDQFGVRVLLLPGVLRLFTRVSHG